MLRVGNTDDGHSKANNHQKEKAESDDAVEDGSAGIFLAILIDGAVAGVKNVGGDDDAACASDGVDCLGRRGLDAGRDRAETQLIRDVAKSGADDDGDDNDRYRDEEGELGKGHVDHLSVRGRD